MTMKKMNYVAVGTILAFMLPILANANGTGKIVDEIIARVNNDIITLSDYQKADAQMRQEAQQDCQGCTQEKINGMIAQGQKNLLRDLIDQSLLVQRAKDMGISADTDVIKRLDMIRQQNQLPSMEALQKAVESQGISWEDYKQQMKNSLLQQKVIQQEVGPDIKIGQDEVKKYYDGHKNEFVKPEEVDLSTIFFSTENKTPQEADAIKKKAEAIVQRLKAGEDFGKLAQKFSEGTTASEGGEVGVFKRGQLSPDIEKLVFGMKKGDSTDVLPAPNGLQILHVNEHFEAGLQPLSKEENEIENDIYSEKIQPAMRKYLTQLRKDSYMVINSGYADSGSAGENTVIQEVPYGTEAGKDKKKKKTPVPGIDDQGDGNP
ncbi:MAG TPA: peptidylprolyl isomerase [Candidatus Acidoferrales bacterium]|nr:peptidylprolyl isomerase [Candidatus Acidoferrales bacterium]